MDKDRNGLINLFSGTCILVHPWLNSYRGIPVAIVNYFERCFKSSLAISSDQYTLFLHISHCTPSFLCFLFSFLIFFPCVLPSLSWSDTWMTVNFFHTNAYNNPLWVKSNGPAASIDFKTSSKIFFEFYLLPESGFLKIKCFEQWNV